MDEYLKPFLYCYLHQLVVIKISHFKGYDDSTKNIIDQTNYLKIFGISENDFLKLSLKVSTTNILPLNFDKTLNLRPKTLQFLKANPSFQ